MEQIRSDYPQQMQWFLRPPVLLIGIMSLLYLIVSITTPLNINSMNSLDGKPILRVQPLSPKQKTVYMSRLTNETIPSNGAKSTVKDKGVVGKIANITSDILVYKNIGGREIPIGVDGSKVSETAVRNRRTIQHVIPLSLFVVAGLIGIQVAKYYMMRRQNFWDGNGSTQFGGFGTRGALSRSVVRSLSSRIRNMSEADRLRLQLALSSRDFTGDDYERLLQLDSAGFNRGATEGQINRLPTSTYSSSSSPNHLPHSRGRRDAGNGASRDNLSITSMMGGYVDSSSVSNVVNRSGDVDNIEGEREGMLAVRSTQCAICLEPYQDGNELRTVMCLHRFHKNCIDRWLRTNCICPICKQRSVE